MSLATAAFGFVVILFGAQVANFHAGLLCLGFPLCDGAVLPPASSAGSAPLDPPGARLRLSGLPLVLAVRVSRRADRRQPDFAPLAVVVLLAATVAQIGVAAAMVLHLLPPALRALHLLVGTLVWARAGRAGVPLRPHAGARRRAAPRPGRATGGRPSLADLVTLTKPRIISLLLVTTVAPMFITPAGLPSEPGPLGAGRRLPDGRRGQRDQHVVRPGHRHPDERGPSSGPIPAGRISPASGLAFGVALGLAAFAVFWYQVNPLSAWLALGGLLFYVFVYTIWLKRTSPQNIVIGGAAGAFPPLVGWAAMTGRLDLAAVYLFAIIFYWTPPHFWALALIKQADYARAGIPMMPVVRGEARTKYEMLVYTLMLLPLTVMPTLFGALGLFYGVAAALLGAPAAVVLHPAPARAVGHAGGVADVPLLAAVPGPPVRGDGHRPGAPFGRRHRAGKVIILGQPASRRCRPTHIHREAPQHASH